MVDPEEFLFRIGVEGGVLVMLSLLVSSDSVSLADWVKDPSLRFMEERLTMLWLRRLIRPED